jgi:hypothetical protein
LSKKLLPSTHPEGSDVGADLDIDRNLTNERFGRVIDKPTPQAEYVRIGFREKHRTLSAIPKAVPSASRERLDDGIKLGRRQLFAGKPFRAEPLEERACNLTHG